MIHIDGNSNPPGGANAMISKRLRLAALGAAVLFAAGCSDEIVSPMAGSAVALMETEGMVATAASKSANETAVVNLRQQSGGDHFAVEWDAPTYTGRPLRDYQVRVDWGSWDSVPASPTHLRLTNVVDGRRYRVEVRARFGDADSGFRGKKSAIYATVPGTHPGRPHRPEGLSHKIRGNGDVQLAWRVADTGGEASSWEFHHGSRWVPIRRDRPGVTYGSHPAGETRFYQVRGVNSHGTGPSASISVTREPLSSTPPGRVRNFTWTAGSRSNEYILSWDRPANHDSNDPVTTYDIYTHASCNSSQHFRPYRPFRSTANITISVFVGFGDETPAFGIKAENSAGTGACQAATAG